MKFKDRIPLWYIIVFAVAYSLPLLANITLCFFTAVRQSDILSASCVIPGAFLIGLLVCSPFFVIYYCALTAIHAVIDEIFVRSRSKIICAVNLSVTFVLSAVLTAHTVSIINTFDTTPEKDISVFALVLFAVLGGLLFVWDIVRSFLVRLCGNHENQTDKER